MRIGILTFHWGTNHGAVLQAYASMQYLQQLNHSVEIIDYYPDNRIISIKKALCPSYPSVMFARICELLKEKRISRFRKYLKVTRHYSTNQELKEFPPEVDALISGSDQVWNPSFAMTGEGKPTPVYFLNFGVPTILRIALSVSFGCVDYPTDAETVVKPYLQFFDSISVRENTGLQILQKMGIQNATLTADPTALLPSSLYLNLCGKSKNNSRFVAKCILRRQSKSIGKLIADIIRANKIRNIKNIAYKSIEDWLTSIRDATLVITNSYHCIMMCIKFHTQFIAILEDGSKIGMNDRLFTLLKTFSLEDRIVNLSSGEIDIALLHNINWESIDILMDEYAETLKHFINESLKLTK